MKLQIIAIGQKMPNWVNEGFAQYQKRMPKEMSLELIELPVTTRKKNDNKNKLQLEEWKRQKERLPKQGIVIALDELGKQWNTLEWAEQMKSWQLETPNVSFLIGGPDGLHQEAKQTSKQSIALGKMTLPHGLARVVLAEQLYRAFTVVQGHPYHREG